MPQMMDDSDTPAAMDHAWYEGDTTWPSWRVLPQEMMHIKLMLDTSSSRGETGTANKALFEVIKDCIPSRTPTSWFLEDRSKQTTTSRLISNGGRTHYACRTPQDVWAAVDGMEPTQTSILMLRNIDSDWCEALCARYPASTDRKFLLEHILGLGLSLSPQDLHKASYDVHMTLMESGSLTSTRQKLVLLEAGLDTYEDMRRTEGMNNMNSEGGSTEIAANLTRLAAHLRLEWELSRSNPSAELSMEQSSLKRRLRLSILLQLKSRIMQLDNQEENAHGFHVNWWHESHSGIDGYRPYILPHDKTLPTADGWVKANAFVSCCRLAHNLCE